MSNTLPDLTTTQPVSAPIVPPADSFSKQGGDAKYKIINSLLLLLVVAFLGAIGFMLYNYRDTIFNKDNSNDNTNNNSNTKYAVKEFSGVMAKYDNSISTPSNNATSKGKITLGEKGKGDENAASQPSILKDGKVYKMWYSSDTNGIYYAQSEDGINWQKNDNSVPSPSDTTSTNGRVPVGTTGKGDSKAVSRPSVIKDGDKFRMWYSGFDGQSWRIFYAESPDGLNWTKTDNSIPEASDSTCTNGRIALGTAGRGDEKNAQSPEVVKDGSMYKMWYSSIATGSNTYLATSTDGLTWTKVDNSIPEPSNTTSTNGRMALGLAGSYDELGARNVTVSKVGNVFHMWYVGVYKDASGTEHSNLFYAKSTDGGYSWTKTQSDNSVMTDKSNGVSGNYTILRGGAGTADEYNVGAATVLLDNTVFKIWYIGVDENKVQRILYAFEVNK